MFLFVRRSFIIEETINVDVASALSSDHVCPNNSISPMDMESLRLCLTERELFSRAATDSRRSRKLRSQASAGALGARRSAVWFLLSGGLAVSQSSSSRLIVRLRDTV